ncbi:linear amide C-N hydrolase [Zwartia vadi]|uniref:linear amide C-N hydrolase n=1 Tax=Zwartia vadi TaxID=3058168 RepID=UPI0025B3BF06|nr:linear amide C-N hydrolase [Zwartia vadi]MDN3987377.1 linear amide C-N hydrolase [Zwartia vadi]
MKLKLVSKLLLSTCLVFSTVANTFACTVLSIRDAQGNVYQGRTNEFAGQQPDAMTYYPAGTRIESMTPDGKPGKTFNTKYGILSVTLNGLVANAKQGTLHEAVNDQGLTITTNALIENNPPVPTGPADKILSAADVGTWALGNFQNVQQVKQALESKEVEVWLPRIPSMANLYAPLHFALYDKAGGSIVIEFTDGKTSVYDNPVAVMTNDPPFPWHLKNMNNYAYLTNIDKNTGQFNNLKVASSDSGGNMASLPSVETSVGRFVKAAYYSNFVHKAETPDQAIKTLSHVMNNFDRPKNISADLPGTASKAEAFAAHKISSESTYFTTMNDLSRGHFYLRTINSINFAKFDVRKLAALKQVKEVKFSTINAYGNLDATDLFLK